MRMIRKRVRTFAFIPSRSTFVRTHRTYERMNPRTISPSRILRRITATAVSVPSTVPPLLRLYAFNAVSNHRLLPYLTSADLSATTERYITASSNDLTTAPLTALCRTVPVWFDFACGSVAVLLTALFRSFANPVTSTTAIQLR